MAMNTTMATTHRNRRHPPAMFNRVYYHRCGNMLPDTITWSDFIVYDEVKDTYSIKLTGRSGDISDGEILCGTLSVNLPEVPLRQRRPEELGLRNTRLSVSQAANATHVDVSGTATVRTPFDRDDVEIRITGTVTLNMHVATTIQYITMDSNDMPGWSLHIELWGDTPKYLEVMDKIRGYDYSVNLRMLKVAWFHDMQKVRPSTDPRITKTIKLMIAAHSYWKLIREKWKLKSICDFWLKETCVNGMALGGVLQKRDRAEFEREFVE